MAKFEFKIKNTAGEIVEGVTEGEDKYAIAAEMRQDGSTVISIDEVVSNKKFSLEKIDAFLGKVKLQEKITFSRNLAAMIDAGLPLARALTVLQKQTKNKKFKDVLSELVANINKGNTLNDSMKKFPKVFSPLFISMVRAGEESGNMSESLRVVSDQLEKTYQLRKKIKGAMMYPSIVLAAMVIIGVLMFIYVVPTLVATFRDIVGEDQLPGSTKLIITISDFMTQHTFAVIGGMIGFVVLVALGLKTKQGGRMFEKLILHLPVIATLVKETNAARTTRTLSSLLSSGVDMIEALTITHDVVQNSHYKEVINLAKEKVQKGIPLSTVFVEREDIYPVLVGAMIEVGEETGKLSDMLLRVALFYEEEVDTATKDLSTIIEPILMVVIGGGVGFFAISMISPIYSLMGNL